MSLKRICAWCQTEMGEIDAPSVGVTHGICPSCLIKLKTKSILRAEHLAAGLTLEEDDHTIQLKRRGQIVARFTIQSSKASILEEANKYLPGIEP